MDQLQSLQTLLSIVDSGSFAAAARALDLAPPVVTRRLAELESQLGVRLLARTTRHVAATEVGASYIARVRPLLQALRDADAEAGRQALQPGGRLRVRAATGFMRDVLMQQLASFRAGYPGVAIDLGATNSLDGHDDAADVSIFLDGGRPLEGDFVAQTIACTEVLLCASPQYLASRPPIVHPNDLPLDECLIANARQVQRPFTLTRRDGGESHTLVPPAAHIASAQPDAMVAAAAAGLGVAGTLSYAAAAALASGALVRVLPQWEIETWRVVATYRSPRALTAAARALIDHLKRKLGGGGLDPWTAGEPAVTVKPPAGSMAGLRRAAPGPSAVAAGA